MHERGERESEGTDERGKGRAMENRGERRGRKWGRERCRNLPVLVMLKIETYKPFFFSPFLK